MILPPVSDPRELAPEEERLERDLTQCVRCAACLPTCPTYQLSLDEGHSPRGRISLVRAVHEGISEETRGLADYLDACLECRACETACPNNVIFHRVIEYGHERHSRQASR
jgi:glycolate oxidase iron-sulfur subunit